MIQKPIREYNNQQYTVAEGAELVEELNNRTESNQDGYNSIDELATKVKEVENAKANQSDVNSLTGRVTQNESDIAGLSGGFRGALYIADTPTLDGIYTPIDEGIYPNAGNLEYSPTTTDEGFDVTFILSGGVWVKKRIEAGLKLSSYYVIGKNKADKNEIEIGHYRDDGLVTTAGGFANSIHIKNVKGVDFTKKYIVSGQRANSPSFVRALTFNSSGGVVKVFYANSSSSQEIDLSLGDTSGGLPVRLAVDISDNYNPLSLPSQTIFDNEFSNAIMVREEGTSSDYESFTKGLPADLIIGNPNDSASKGSLDLLEDKVDLNKIEIDSINDFIETESFKVYKFEINAKYDLPEAYLLKNDGDFIEFESRFDGADYKDGLGLFGHNTGLFRSLIGYNTSNSIFIKEILDGAESRPYIKFEGLPDLTVFRKIKIVVDSGNYNLYIDNVFIDSKPVVVGTSIKTIGDAYGSFFIKSSFKKLEINTSTQSLVITNFLDSNATNVELIYQKKDSSTVFPEFFYEVNPTGGNMGSQQVICYTKRLNSNDIYVGHSIERYTDSDPIVHVDYFRNRGANNYRFNGVSMIQLATIALLPIENEFTLMQVGKSDHTGGIHGDEMMNEVVFIADGKELDINTLKSLTPCDSLEYHETSTLHETSNIATPTVPIVGNPIIAEHIKTVIFDKGGYRVVNTVKGKVSPHIEIDRIYTGLICNHKDQASFGFTEIHPKHIFTGDMSAVFNNNISREFFGANNSTSLGSHITSRCVYPPEYDSLRKMYVTDRVGDSKYYSMVSNFNLELNKVVIVECTLICK